MKIHSVVMAGGSGTRFWPLSRRARPKQLLPLVSERPLIVETAARVEGLSGPERTWVVCGRAHAQPIRRLLKAVPAGNVLVEPAARNTAPAIGLAALQVAAVEPKGILAVLPSDHHVGDVAGFRRVLRAAAKVARTGALVTVGIQPDRPETGYGYIRVGEPLDGGVARKVRAFVEKPDLATARRYLRSGDYLWNGGIFVFRADAILDALAEHMPELHRGLVALAPRVGTRGYAQALAKVFPKLPAVSIDYGVMEKAKNLAVVPGDFGWSDVGSFSALPEVRPLDARGNVVSGKAALAIDCRDCVVLGADRPVAAVGLEGLVVVDAGDAVLVVPKDRAQDVRRAVEALKERRLGRYL